MARTIVWSPRAADSLEEICAYIARDSEHYASLFAQRILAAVEDLIDLPEIGRVVPEFNDPLLRERIVGHYRVVYRLLPGAIQVLVITHGSRMLKL